MLSRYPVSPRFAVENDQCRRRRAAVEGVQQTGDGNDERWEEGAVGNARTLCFASGRRANGDNATRPVNSAYLPNVKEDMAGDGVQRLGGG